MKKVVFAILILVIAQLACSFGNNKKVNALIEQGDQLLEEEKYAEAISIYNQALEFDEESSYAYSGRGTANRHLGNNELALDDLTKAIDFDSKNYKAYRERGMVYYSAGENSTALNDCKKSVSINTDYALGHLCLAYVYESTNDYDMAINEYTSTISLDSSIPWAYAGRGVVYYNYYNDKYSNAIEDFSEALILKSNWDYALFYRGLSYFSLGDDLSAIKDLQQVLSLSNDEYFITTAYGYLGDSYFAQKDYSLAIKYYTLAINNQKDEGVITYLYHDRAVAYDQIGDIENTIADFSSYLDRDQSNSEYAMEACARLNYLTIWGSSNIFSLFFNAVAPPCSRNQGYSNNEDYNTPLNAPDDYGSLSCDEGGTCDCGGADRNSSYCMGYFQQLYNEEHPVP